MKTIFTSLGIENPCVNYSRKPLYIALRALMASVVASSPLLVNAAEQVQETVMKPVSVKAKLEDGSAEQGYRTEKVSAAGPWQGRDLQDTPYAITVFSEDLIKNLQATTPDQVLRINPTTQLVRPQHENNQPRVMIRGFMVQKSYRDGVPDDQYSHTATMEDTAQIEILNGLSGFLYGANNVGGVVNYVTKSSTQERLNRITVSNLGNESWYGHGDFGGKFDSEGRYGYRVNLVEQGGEGAIDRQAIEKTFYSVALDGYLAENFWVQINAMDYTYDVNGSQAYWYINGQPRPSASKIDNDVSWGQPWTNRWYDYNRYGVNMKWEINDRVGIRAAYIDNRGSRGSESASNYLTANNTYQQRLSGVYAGGVDKLLSRQVDKGSAIYADFAFDTGSIQHKLTTGVQTNDSRQYRLVDPNTRKAVVVSTININSLPMSSPTVIARPDGILVDRGVEALDSHTKYQSLVFGDDITFNDQWSALLGAARTNTQTKFGSKYDESKVTPSVSVIYKPVSTVTTYASYIEALEAGVVAPAIYNNSLVVLNEGQTFDPLISEQIEFGVKTNLGGVAIDTAVFQIDKGLQYYVLSSPGFVYYAQDGRQIHRGIELTAMGNLTQQLNIIGGFTWLDAEITKQKENPSQKGNRPADVAEYLAKLRLEYSLPQVPQLSVSAAAMYNGSSYTQLDNVDKVPGYTLFDLGTRYSFVLAEQLVTLRADLSNVTNKHYWNGFNGTRIGDPRTLMLSATVEF